MKYEVEYHVVRKMVVEAGSKLEAAETCLNNAEWGSNKEDRGVVVHSVTPMFNQDVD
jgi:hypothetical protein